MARAGDTKIVFNQKYFDAILRESKVEAVVDAAAEKVLAAAKASAPVDTGDYRNSLHIEHHNAKYRRSARVVGDDDKTMLIEAKSGNLARAVKAAKA